MAIDYVIDQGCEPKDQFTTAGLLSMLKGRDQAQRVIQLYHEAGENRPYDQMGFELTRSTPEGEEETQTVRISDLLEATKPLDTTAHHCEGCPANITGEPFGCFGRISYPLSDHAERWLLLQLPLPDQALMVWTLLGEQLKELNLHLNDVQQLRGDGTYFESAHNPRRRLGDIALSGNNLFYMLFMQGHIPPSRAAVIMLFFNVIPRNLDAAEMYNLTPAPADAAEKYAFQLKPEPEIDDTTVTELKQFFRALYTAWRLNVNLLLDV